MLLFQFRNELELSVEFSPQLNFHYKHTQITTDILNSYMSNDFFFLFGHEGRKRNFNRNTKCKSAIIN